MLNLLLLVAMAAMFGFNPVAGRALAGIVEPGQLTLVRWIIAGGLVAVLALARGPRERWVVAPSSWPVLVVIGMVGMGFCSLAAFAAAKTTTATNISLIYSSTAAIVLAIEWTLRQSKATVLLVAGVGLCLFGAAVIISKGRLETLGSLTFTVGDLWALAGTIGWALYTLALKHTRSGLTPFAMFAITALGGALFALPVAGYETVDIGIRPLGPVHVAWVLAMALLCGVGAFLTYSFCLARVGPILTSAALTLNPLATAVFAVALVGETLSWFHGVGGALVIGGLALINLDKARATSAIKS
jgi:drug/metabolite transporter (DMT)-like permease